MSQEQLKNMIVAFLAKHLGHKILVADDKPVYDMDDLNEYRQADGDYGDSEVAALESWKAIKKKLCSLCVPIPERSSNETIGHLREKQAQYIETVGCPLPEEYLRFLRVTEGAVGFPEGAVCEVAAVGNVAAGQNRISVAFLYGLLETEQYDACLACRRHAGLLRQGLVPIGEDVRSRLLCLGVGMSHEGRVVLLLSGEEGSTESAAQNLMVLAHSFESFLQALHLP